MLGPQRHKDSAPGSLGPASLGGWATPEPCVLCPSAARGFSVSLVACHCGTCVSVRPVVLQSPHCSGRGTLPGEGGCLLPEAALAFSGCVNHQVSCVCRGMWKTAACKWGELLILSLTSVFQKNTLARRVSTLLSQRAGQCGWDTRLVTGRQQ